MTTRRVPPPVTDFITGPAERVLARVWQPAVDLLRALQAAAESKLPDYLKAGADQGSLVWLAGGAVRAALDGETPRDLDFFCTGPSAHLACFDFIRTNYDHTVLPEPETSSRQARVVKKLLVRLDGVREHVKSVNDLLQGDAHLSFSDTCTGVDLVRRFAPSPLDTARQMDFVCCAAALSTKTYARHARFEDDVHERVLRVCAPWAPRASMRRVERFVERGWTISVEELGRLQVLADDPRMPEWDFTGSRDGSVRPEGEGRDYGDRFGG